MGQRLVEVGGRSLVTDTQHAITSALKTSQAAIGPATGLLCKHIIHVHSPGWSASGLGGAGGAGGLSGEDASASATNVLERAIDNILTIAHLNKMHSVALPSVGSGGCVLDFI